MRLYARAGRMADALRQHHGLERVLREELGIRSSAATRTLLAQLHERGVFTVVSAGP
jgi:DNA-binding SARP family transcriptional activator